MKTSALLLLLSALLTTTVSLAGDPPAPDISGIVRLFGRSGMAHGCPVAPDLVLTAAHVVDPEPLDPNAGLLPSRFESLDGTSFGYAEPIAAGSSEDAAFVTLSAPVGHTYRLGAQPLPGERVWWVGYDWRNRKEMFAVRVLSGTVLRVVAGMIIIDQETPPGSSGSCVLNAAGEAVGVIVLGVHPDDTTAHEVTAAAGIWPPWLNKLRASAARVRAKKAQQ